MEKLILKIIIFTTILLLWFSPTKAQELGAELFFNVDPGLGNGIAFDPQSNESVDMVIGQAAEILEPGKHAAFVRVRENSFWSHYSFVGYVVVQQSLHASLVSGEYFFNTKPGAGAGNEHSLGAADVVDSELTVNATGLPQGRHYLHYRVGNGSMWSHYIQLPFTVIWSYGAVALNGAEYFINYDPGQSAATSTAIDPSNEIDLTIDLSPETMEPGRQFLHFRVRNGHLWSHYTQLPLTVTGSNEMIVLNGAEFFLHSDPGQGAATATAIDPASEIDLTLDLNPDTMDPGRKYLHFRVRNDHLWSHYMQFPFTATRSKESIAPLASLHFFINESDEEVHSWSTTLLGETADSLDGDFGLSAEGLPVGTHKLFLKTTDNSDLMSHYVPIEFQVCESIQPLIETDGTLLTCIADEIPDAWQWLLNGDTLAGATSQQYTALQSGLYSVVVYHGECVEESPAVEIEIEIVCDVMEPQIQIDGMLLTCITNEQPDAYQWFLFGEIIEGAVEETYLATETGLYQVVVYYDGCEEASEEVLLDIPVNEILVFSGAFTFDTQSFLNISHQYEPFGFNTLPYDDIIVESDLFLFDTRSYKGYSVTINGVPRGSLAGTTGEGTYFFNDKVTVSVTLNKGYTFINWTNQRGNVLSTSISYDFSMPDQDITLNANSQLTTGTDDPAISGLLVFPNPATNHVNIQAKEVISGIRITDIQGRLVFASEPENHESKVLTEGFVTGIYIINIDTALGSYVRRLVIQ